MQTLHKYVLKNDRPILMMVGAQFASVSFENGAIILWAWGPKNSLVTTHHFRIDCKGRMITFSTGMALLIGTVKILIDNCLLDFNIFEVGIDYH